jgi:hypothetical protein
VERKLATFTRIFKQTRSAGGGVQSLDGLVSKQSVKRRQLPILSLLSFLKSRSFQSGVFADLGSAGSNPARDKTKGHLPLL